MVCERESVKEGSREGRIETLTWLSSKSFQKTMHSSWVKNIFLIE